MKQNDNFEKLTRKNFELFAAKHYNNPECMDIEEFKDDLSRFKYMPGNRHFRTGEGRDVLIILVHAHTFCLSES